VTEPLSESKSCRNSAGYGKNSQYQTFWGWNDVWLNPEFRSWNIEEYLPAIRVPMLLVQGADDQYGTREQLRRIEAGSSGPVRTLLLTNCGHSPHLDRSELAVEAMKDFVKRHSTGPERSVFRR